MSTPPAVVLVEGEAGIGKSRLLSEYLASTLGSQQTSLVAVCPPYRQPQTLAPIVDAVRRSVDGVGDLGLSALACQGHAAEVCNPVGIAFVAAPTSSLLGTGGLNVDACRGLPSSSPSGGFRSILALSDRGYWFGVWLECRQVRLLRRPRPPTSHYSTDLRCTR